MAFSILRCAIDSTHLNTLHSQQCAKLLELLGNVADSHRTMMGWPVQVPLSDEVPSTQGETIAAVGVAYFQYPPGHGFAFRHQQLQLGIHRLQYGKPCRLAVL